VNVGALSPVAYGLTQAAMNGSRGLPDRSGKIDPRKTQPDGAVTVGGDVRLSPALPTATARSTSPSAMLAGRPGVRVAVA